MKRLFIFLGMSLMLLASCEQEERYEVAYINESEGSSFTPAEVSALGDEITINFSTNYTWQVKGYTKLNFCSLSALKGEAGDVSLIVTVQPNTTDAVRKDEFTILAGAAVKTVVVTQTETNAVEIDTRDFVAEPGGDIIEVQVSANVEYTVNIPSDITWVREMTRSKAMVNSTVMLQVDPNDGWLARSASGITVTGKDVNGNDIVIPLNVSQDAPVRPLLEKDFSGDYSVIDRKSSTGFHLAMFDGLLIVADGIRMHKINPSDGAYVGEFTIPECPVDVVQTIANDDAGNLVFAKTALCDSEDFVVYVYDGNAVKELARYGKGSLYTGRLGNLRVIGDVKSKAVIAAVANSVNYFVAWQVENGVASKPVAKPIPGNGINSIVYGVTSPVSDDLNDGLVFIGYSGKPYCLWYSSKPAEANKDNWRNIFDTKTAGNENFNAVSIAEFKGKKYCAISQDGHFGWSVAPKVYLLDITDMSDVKLVYEAKFAGALGKVGVNDVKLIADGDKLRIYLVNAGWNYAGCVELE